MTIIILYIPIPILPLPPLSKDLPFRCSKAAHPIHEPMSFLLDVVLDVLQKQIVRRCNRELRLGHCQRLRMPASLMLPVAHADAVQIVYTLCAFHFAMCGTWHRLVAILLATGGEKDGGGGSGGGG